MPAARHDPWRDPSQQENTAAVLLLMAGSRDFGRFDVTFRASLQGRCHGQGEGISIAQSCGGGGARGFYNRHFRGMHHHLRASPGMQDGIRLLFIEAITTVVLQLYYSCTAVIPSR